MLLQLIAVTLAADPIPVGLSADARQQVLDLLAVPPQRLYLSVRLDSRGAFNDSAVPLHREELARIDRWLALVPEEHALLGRAHTLADLLGDAAAKQRYAAALNRLLLGQTVAAPRLTVARLAYAGWLGGQGGRIREAEAVARQAVRLDPESQRAWLCLATQCGPLDAEDEFESAVLTAERLNPDDWRVPAVRAMREFWRVGLRGAGNDPAALAEAVAAAEPNRQRAEGLVGDDRDGLLMLVAARMQAARSAANPDDRRRSLRALLVPFGRLAEADPVDARIVTLLTMFELSLHMTAADDESAVAIQKLPAASRERVERLLSRVAATVATDAGPEAAEKAVTAAVLFSTFKRFPQAVAAAERAVNLRPGQPYCEEILQEVLARAGRPADALSRCRANPAGRTPPLARLFEVECLQRLGRWEAASKMAERGLNDHPDDLRLALAAAACLLQTGLPSKVDEAERRVIAMAQSLDPAPAGQPDPHEGIRREATRLIVIAELLASRPVRAQALLDNWRQGGRPLADDRILSAAARPVVTARFTTAFDPDAPVGSAPSKPTVPPPIKLRTAFDPPPP